MTIPQGLALLFSVAGFGLFAAAFVWAIRSHARRTAEEARERPIRERRARELGWRYDGTPDGDIRYRFEGAGRDGLRWTMKFDSDASSSSSSPRLIWHTSALAAQRTELMLGERVRMESLTRGAARKLLGAANFVLGRVVGASLQDMNDFVAAAQVATDGSNAATAFAIAARDPAMGRRLLRDSELARLLKAWPRGMPKGFAAPRAVSAELGRTGLTVTVSIDGPSMAACEHLAALGELLASRLRSAEGLRSSALHS
jgi:hypothetical protein